MVGAGLGRRLLMLCAGSQAQCTGRDGQDHNCFKNLHVIFFASFPCKLLPVI